MLERGYTISLVNSNLEFTAVQIGQTFAINAFCGELSYVLVHVHAHQPVTHLLIGPLRKGAVLPQVLLCDWTRFIIEGLNKNTGMKNTSLHIYTIYLHKELDIQYLTHTISGQVSSSNNIQR